MNLIYLTVAILFVIVNNSIKIDGADDGACIIRLNSKGNDDDREFLEKARVSDVEECCAKCVKNPECTYFNLIRGGSPYLCLLYSNTKWSELSFAEIDVYDTGSPNRA
jgi:hypothetical protein